MKKKRRRVSNGVPVEEILKKEKERCPTIFSGITVIYSLVTVPSTENIAIWQFFIGLALIWGLEWIISRRISKRRLYITRRKKKLRKRTAKNKKIIPFPSKEVSTRYSGEK